MRLLSQSTSPRLRTCYYFPGLKPVSLYRDIGQPSEQWMVFSSVGMVMDLQKEQDLQRLRGLLSLPFSDLPTMDADQLGLMLRLTRALLRSTMYCENFSQGNMSPGCSLNEDTLAGLELLKRSISGDEMGTAWSVVMTRPLNKELTLLGQDLNTSLRVKRLELHTASIGQKCTMILEASVHRSSVSLSRIATRSRRNFGNLS